MPAPEPDPEAVRLALIEFCETIEATDGIDHDIDGFPFPVGDPSWGDLAEAYLSACRALDRKPCCCSPEED